MQKLTCESCGSLLVSSGNGRYKCEYCGTLYKEEGYTMRNLLVVSQAKAERLCAEIAVPKENLMVMDKEILSRYTIQQLQHQLAEGLAAFMKITTEDARIRNAMIVRGEVRVLPPDFRY